MSQNKSTSHNFQSMRLIYLLLGSLMMTISVEAAMVDTLDGIRGEFQNMLTYLRTPPENANNISIVALRNTINNGVARTQSTSSIGTHVTAASPDKFTIELDVMSIESELNSIRAHLTRVENLLSPGSHSLFNGSLTRAELKC
ncbi:hypothetical protein DdX_11829 [Ditylenchus destructor]|uniref:Uncharacterized protein n=1 Tax=Ditylenchus destructor TaxID=166010 RepID=A0AAD4QXU7_9BILA|nr:hypothetical protein DdX_11829 [Ditylenchus destructor]